MLKAAAGGQEDEDDDEDEDEDDEDEDDEDEDDEKDEEKGEGDEKDEDEDAGGEDEDKDEDKDDEPPRPTGIASNVVAKPPQKVPTLIIPPAAERSAAEVETSDKKGKKRKVGKHPASALRHFEH